ncbi:porin family protein [Salinimicrobium sp. GXAS 041]|uniref:porin family protein n=1 Tax=Salinimicrobium sp. GXAS 041 TaxID=3400806 RepID=UPI003C725B79
MKKSILFLAMIVFSTSIVSAQEFVRFGAKGGVNFTNMTSDGFEENNSRTGFHLGLLAEVPLSERFAIQPEVLYSTQGTEAESNFMGDNYTGEYNLDYIQVPVLTKLYVFEGLSIEAGPSFNFLVEEEISVDSDLGESSTDTDFGSTFEFGGAVGVSFNFTDQFFASARYTRGFTDAFDSDNWDEDAVNNNGFQLGVGIMF